MFRALILALPVLVIACAFEPPPQAPVASHPSPDETAQQAEIARLQANGTIVTPERAASYQAEMQAQQKASNDAIASAHAQQQATVDARAEAQRKSCEDTRAGRARHAQDMVRDRLNGEARLLRNAKGIMAVCKLAEVKTGATHIDRNGSGWTVRPELRDDVKCSGPLPKEVSKDDAYVLLFRAREGQFISTGAILDREDHSPEDGICTTFDAAVGLNLDPTHGDNDSISRLAKWKPTP